MASEANYNNYSGEGSTEIRLKEQSDWGKAAKYSKSDEFKDKLNNLEEYLKKNSYKKLEPGVDKLEKGKTYYIIIKYSDGDLKAKKIKCNDVKPDGKCNFENENGITYNNYSIDSFNDNTENYYGIWNRNMSLNTVLGIGSASKYKAGKKLRKSRKSRKSKGKSRKTIKTKRR